MEASGRPCDIGTSVQIDEAASLPIWYDPVAYKRCVLIQSYANGLNKYAQSPDAQNSGQRYFHDNRCGIFESNLFGLITLLCEPKGLQLLASTGKSCTPARAKLRYVSTIRHVQHWYNIELTPGSKSWQSLQRVRRLHLHASNQGTALGIGGITQMELVLTTFGFMG